MNKLYSLKSLIIFLLLFSFFSCKKEAEDPAKLLIGSWNQVSTHALHYYDYVKINETTTTYGADEYVLDILANGTANRYNYGKLSGAFYWRIEGDLLIITYDSGVNQKTAFTVSESSFTMKWAVEDTVDGHITRSEYESVYMR